MDAYKKGDLENARKLLLEAAVAEPQNGDCQAILGYLLAQAGQFDEALPHLEKAITLRTISISPTNSRMNLGKALLMRPAHTDSDIARAVTLFEQAVDLSPRSEEAQMTLGYGYTRAARYDKAVGAYRHATEIAPNDAVAWKTLGLTLRKTGPVGEAIAALKKSADLNGSDAETWANLGDAYMDHAEAPAALSAFESGRKAAPGNVPILIRLGNLNSRLNHFAAAADAYGAAADRLDTDPASASGVNVASLRYDQGAALAKAGRTDEAEAAYEKAITANPNSTDALINSGYLLFKQGKLDSAMGRFRKVTELDPTSELAWRNLAAAATQNHDWETAAMGWRKVAALAPANYEARDTLAEVILQQNPTSDSAIPIYSQMAKLHSKSPDPLIGLGLLYQRQAEAASLASVKQAKLILAMNSFTDAIHRDPRSAIAYNNLGVVHERRGELPEAVTAYKKALAIDPGLTDARKNLSRFSNVTVPPSKPAPSSVRSR